MHPRIDRLSLPRILLGMAVMTAGVALDIRYFMICQGEMTTFRERSRTFGNWRERQTVKPVDVEVMKE